MKKFGLFGEKLGHSMSPYIFKLLFDKYDIVGTYSLFEIEKECFDKAISSAKILGINGINITIPYKTDIISQLDEVDESVEKIGACNCVSIKNNIAKGFNTDYYGVLKAFNYHDIIVKDKDCFILGSGGASKSVVALLKRFGASNITIVQRVKNQQDNEFIKYIDYEELKNIEKGYLLINTTPVGMYPDIEKSPVDQEIIEKFDVLFDAVYNPIDTKFLNIGRRCNKKVIDGLYMLVGQGIEAFSIFNEIKVEEKEFINIYKEVKKVLEVKI